MSDEQIRCWPGDDLARLRKRLSDTEQRHAKLVEAARAVVRYRQTRGIGGIAAVVDELAEVLADELE